MIVHGDCLRAMSLMQDSSMDSLVCDPPAGISFMGKGWDHHKGGRTAWVAWMTEVMAETLRVLKPGAHGLVWAIPRTSHWTATALEDAGFEVRDVITHLQGQGFPKSLDIAKAIDKMAGAEREIVGSKIGQPGYSLAESRGVNLYEGSFGGTGDPVKESQITAPATDAAKQWDGWGTALKPGAEHWILVRKPLSAKSVAANVLQWGTGGINIDACRIGAEVTGRWPTNVVLSHAAGCVQVGERKVQATRIHGAITRSAANGKGQFLNNSQSHGDQIGYGDPDGTETIAAYDCEPGCPVAGIDEQSGERPGLRVGVMRRNNVDKDGNPYPGYGGGWAPNEVITGYGDTGGASRFFTVVPDPPYLYTPKAPPKERPVGPDGTKHPTVKSVALMRWLCRLITPPGGRVLDPFAGSGATIEAALLEGFRYLAIEAEPTYIPMIKQRIDRTGLLGITA